MSEITRKCDHCGREMPLAALHQPSAQINHWICNDDPATDLRGISFCVRYAAHKQAVEDAGKPQGMENRG